MNPTTAGTETRTYGEGGPVSAFAEALGEALRRVRKRRNMGLRDVQHLSGGRFMSASVSSYERGIRQVKAETLTQLAAFYGVPVMTLLPVQGSSGGSGTVAIDDLQAYVDSLRGVA